MSRFDDGPEWDDAPDPADYADLYDERVCRRCGGSGFIGVDPCGWCPEGDEEDVW